MSIGRNTRKMSFNRAPSARAYDSTRFKGIICVAAVVLSIGVGAATPHAASIIVEINELEKEEDQLSAEIDRAEPEMHAGAERVLRVLKPESERLVKESAILREAAKEVDAACNLTARSEEFAAATSRCLSIQDPYNRRVDILNNEADRLRREFADIVPRLQAFVDKKDRLQYVTAAIAAKKSELTAKLVEECVTRCKSAGSDESSAQCLSVCWDQAKQQVEAVVHPGGTRFFGQ